MSLSSPIFTTPTHKKKKKEREENAKLQFDAYDWKCYESSIWIQSTGPELIMPFNIFGDNL